MVMLVTILVADWFGPRGIVESHRIPIGRDGWWHIAARPILTDSHRGESTNICHHEVASSRTPSNTCLLPHKFWLAT